MANNKPLYTPNVKVNNMDAFKGTETTDFADKVFKAWNKQQKTLNSVKSTMWQHRNDSVTIKVQGKNSTVKLMDAMSIIVPELKSSDFAALTTGAKQKKFFFDAIDNHLGHLDSRLYGTSNVEGDERIYIGFWSEKSQSTATTTTETDEEGNTYSVTKRRTLVDKDGKAIKVCTFSVIGDNAWTVDLLRKVLRQDFCAKTNTTADESEIANAA